MAVAGTSVPAGRVRRIADSLPSQPVGVGRWLMLAAGLVCTVCLLGAGEGVVALVHGVAGISRGAGVGYVAGGLAVAVPAAYLEALGWSNFVRERARRRVAAALALSAALAAVIACLSLVDSLLPPIEASSGGGGGATQDSRRRRRGAGSNAADRRLRTRTNFATGLITAAEMAGLLGVSDAWVSASAPDTPTWSVAQAGPIDGGRRRAYPRVRLVVRQLRTPAARRYEGLRRRAGGDIAGCGDRACRLGHGVVVLVDDTIVHLRLVARGGPTGAQSQAMIDVLGGVVERLRTPG